MSEPFVALYFIVEGKILLHKCRLENAEHYGNLKNYPRSHVDVWEKHYLKLYGRDFDYYPRGRVIYNKATDIFTIYYDPCCVKEARHIRMLLGNRTCEMRTDKQYTCHMCSDFYEEGD